MCNDLNDPNGDPRVLTDLVRRRDELLKRAAEYEGLQRERDLQLQGLNTRTAVSANQSGGLLGRLREDLRPTAVAAANRYGVPLDFLLATMGNESNFRVDADASKNFSNSRAYGLMQLQPRIAAGLGVDPRDPAQNIMGGADYLGQAYRKARGNEAEACRLYHDGLYSTALMSAEARAGFANIQRMRGAPTDAANITAERQRNDAIETSTKQLQAAKEAQGRDAEGLRARQELIEAEARERAKGNVLNAETVRQLEAEARQRLRLVTEGRLNQYGLDSALERDQLGRNSAEASAYSRARSVVGDVTSKMPRASSQSSR